MDNSNATGSGSLLVVGRLQALHNRHGRPPVYDFTMRPRLLGGDKRAVSQFLLICPVIDGLEAVDALGGSSSSK